MQCHISNLLNLFCHRLGLDPKLLADVMNVSTGQSWSSQKYNPVPGVVPGVPASNNYDGGFGAALMLKVSFEMF